MKANNAIDEMTLIKQVEYLFYGHNQTVAEICDQVFMTETELRAIPEIEELFNK